MVDRDEQPCRKEQFPLTKQMAFFNSIYLVYIDSRKSF